MRKIDISRIDLSTAFHFGRGDKKSVISSVVEKSIWALPLRAHFVGRYPLCGDTPQRPVFNCHTERFVWANGANATRLTPLWESCLFALSSEGVKNNTTKRR